MYFQKQAFGHVRIWFRFLALILHLKVKNTSKYTTKYRFSKADALLEIK